MKLRNGFVSNSSTSSFIILCKAEDYNKALDVVTKGAPLIRQAIVDQVFGTAEAKVDKVVYGQPLKHFAFTTDRGFYDFPSECDYLKGGDEEIPIDENGKKVPKKKRASAENVQEAVAKLLEEITKMGGFTERDYS